MSRTEKDFNKIFAENLKRYLDVNKMTQKQFAALVGVSAPTVTDWLKAKISPRMDKVDKMCEIFGCSRSDLIQQKSENEFKKTLLEQQLFSEQKILLSATEGLSPEDVKFLVQIAERMKAGNRDV